MSMLDQGLNLAADHKADGIAADESAKVAEQLSIDAIIDFANRAIASKDPATLQYVLTSLKGIPDPRVSALEISITDLIKQGPQADQNSDQTEQPSQSMGNDKEKLIDAAKNLAAQRVGNNAAIELAGDRAAAVAGEVLAPVATLTSSINAKIDEGKPATDPVSAYFAELLRKGPQSAANAPDAVSVAAALPITPDTARVPDIAFRPLVADPIG